MPAQLIPGSRTVVLTLQTGVDQEGNPKYKSISYGQMKSNATLDGIYSFAQAVANLQAFTLVSLGLVDRGRLIQA
jgi:hypothetical protein